MCTFMSVLCIGTCSSSIKDLPIKDVMSQVSLSTFTCSVLWPVLGAEPCGLLGPPLSAVL